MDHGPRGHDFGLHTGLCRRTVQPIDSPVRAAPARSIPSSSRLSLPVHNPESAVRSAKVEPDILSFATVRHLFQPINGTEAEGYG